MLLITHIEEFDNIKSRGFVVLKCMNEKCNKEFLKTKHEVQRALRKIEEYGESKKCNFCSRECAHLSRKSVIRTTCSYCKQTIFKKRI